MDWQFTPVAVLYAATVIIGLVTARIAWRFHPTRGARLLALTALSSSIWGLGYSLGVFNSDLSWKRHMIRIEYVGQVGVPFFFFLFAMAYTSFDRWLNRKTITLFTLVPALGLLLALSHDLHPLIYQSLGLTTVNGFVVTQKTYGIGFWILAVHNYLLVSVAALMLLSDTIRHSQMFKGQTVLMVVGALAPLFSNLAYVSGINPARPHDLTPITFIVSNTLLLVGVRRFRLLNLVPIAHDMVFRNVTSGVLVINAEGQVLEINPAAEQILGRTQAEVTGKSILEAFPEHNAVIEQYRDVKEAHALITLQSGNRIYEMQITPLCHPWRAQKVIGRVVLLNDITKREQLIADLNAFTHSVAHDLKTPLFAVQGYAELLRIDLADAMTARTESLSRSIILASSNMDAIIRSQLLLAQLRRVDEISTGRVDLGAVMSSALSRFEYHFLEANAEIIQPQHWPDGLISYAPWIEEVWSNYIGNALKYGGQPPRIEVGFTPLPGQRMRFWVRDNGQGLSDSESQALFTEFARLDRHTATEGHGLGLSIVQRIVSRLGGVVGVDSKPGEGSTFYFVLPLMPVGTSP